MADWVSASTDAFWTESANCVYLGSGNWELVDLEVLTSSALSPIAVAEKSVWGIRLTLSGGAYLVSGYVLTFANYGDIYPGTPNPLESILDEVDRGDGIYISSFDPGLWRGEGYGNVIISDIELYTDWVPGEGDNGCPCPAWMSYAGTEEICTVE